MKIYFGFSVAGDRSSLPAAKQIVAILERLGHEVLTRHLVSEDVFEQDRLVPATQIFERDMNWLRQCDLFIAEVSGSTFGLGFESGYVLGATDKSVVLFYRKESETGISLLISGNTHPRCTLFAYSNTDEIETFLLDNLKRLGAGVS